MKEVLRRHSEFLPQCNILIKELKASPDLLRGEENLLFGQQGGGLPKQRHGGQNGPRVKYWATSMFKRGHRGEVLVLMKKPS